jgi:hypothetical protein
MLMRLAIWLPMRPPAPRLPISCKDRTQHSSTGVGSLCGC